MPPKRRSLAAVVRAAEDVLRGNHVEHVFVGAVSVIVFGEPRTTRDVDIVARVPEDKVADLVKHFRRKGFLASEYDFRAALMEGGHCSLDDSRFGPRIDLAFGGGAAAERTLRTKIAVRWHGFSIPVAAPETTVVMKLKFGSSQDIEDAFGILTEQWNALDFAGMRDFAARERVLRDLEALEERARTSIRRRSRGRDSRQGPKG
ncbi:MAG TPA: hypothetical protein VEM95_00715 [Thermoplasmata archaeon]|nr:hypothetical protein [Thermoplasmata archaeon]